MEAKIVTEYCAECESEITLFWDVRVDGYKAYCPVYGSRLMLCDECTHRKGKYICDCDYDSKTDSCKFMRQKTEPIIELIKNEISKFCWDMYRSTADFSNEKKVDVAYTTTEDEEHEIQVSINLVGYSIDTYIDGKLGKTQQFNSEKELYDNLNLVFDELVDVSDIIEEE